MNLLPYLLEFEQDCFKSLSKAGAKNQELKKAAINKLRQIQENPRLFKPLRAPMQNKRRVHVLKSFVLVFEILERENKVRILDFDHHDSIYK